MALDAVSSLSLEALSRDRMHPAAGCELGTCSQQTRVLRCSDRGHFLSCFYLFLKSLEAEHVLLTPFLLNVRGRKEKKKKSNEFTVKLSGSVPITWSLQISKAAFLKKNTMAQAKNHIQVFLDLKGPTPSLPVEGSQADPN